jgi:hypothetical protein
MKNTKLAILAVGLSLVSASVFASPNCNDYVAGANQAIAKYIATTGSSAYKDIGFNKKGNFTFDKSQSGMVDFWMKSYTLPTAVVKKVYYRFTDAATMGTRTSTGRLVCRFRGEYSDSFVTGTDERNFDVDPFSKTSNVSMTYSPGEPRGGWDFDAGAIAQWIISSAITKAVVNDPEYKAQMAKLR